MNGVWVISVKVLAGPTIKMDNLNHGTVDKGTSLISVLGCICLLGHSLISSTVLTVIKRITAGRNLGSYGYFVQFIWISFDFQGTDL